MQEWRNQLRSSLHPRLFAVAYLVVDHVARFLGMSPHLRSEALVVIPNIVQGLIAALGDWYTWRLAERLFGHKDVKTKAVVSDPGVHLPRRE